MFPNMHPLTEPGKFSTSVSVENMFESEQEIKVLFFLRFEIDLVIKVMVFFFNKGPRKNKKKKVMMIIIIVLVFVDMYEI